MFLVVKLIYGRVYNFRSTSDMLFPRLAALLFYGAQNRKDFSGRLGTMFKRYDVLGLIISAYDN
jgi:hypothetical protein